MSILITSDWHLNDNPRDNYRHKFQRRLRDIVEDTQSRTLVMLGDLTEAKEGHNAHLVNRIAMELMMLSRLTRVIVLMGNHDYINPSIPFFEFVKYIPNIEWVADPCVLQIDKKRYLFLPHTTEWKTEWNPTFFKNYCKPPIEAVFTHATFRGAVSESGETLDGIPLDIIPKGPPVISGDIHAPQTLGRLTYVGSPYTIRFGDEFEPRVLHIKNGIWTSIVCPGPQKRLIEARSIESAMKRINRHPNDILKVRIDWKREDFAKWGAARRDLLEWAKEKNIPLYGVEAFTEEGPKSKKYKVSRAQSDSEVISAYCKANGVNSVLEGIGQKIAKEVA